MVVLFTLIINSVVEKGPIIFLRMAEGYHGEIDGVISAAGYLKEGNKRREIFLNYTTINKLFNGTHTLAPRKTFGS